MFTFILIKKIAVEL